MRLPAILHIIKLVRLTVSKFNDSVDNREEVEKLKKFFSKFGVTVVGSIKNRTYLPVKSPYWKKGAYLGPFNNVIDRDTFRLDFSVSSYWLVLFPLLVKLFSIFGEVSVRTKLYMDDLDTLTIVIKKPCSLEIGFKVYSDISEVVEVVDRSAYRRYKKGEDVKWHWQFHATGEPWEVVSSILVQVYTFVERRCGGK